MHHFQFGQLLYRHLLLQSQYQHLRPVPKSHDLRSHKRIIFFLQSTNKITAIKTKARNLLALLITTWVPLRCQHNTYHRIIFPLKMQRCLLSKSMICCIKSLSIRVNRTCASGSPKRALNSITLGPYAVMMAPIYNTPKTDTLL